MLSREMQQESIYQVGTIRVRLLSGGEGATLLFLHGSGGLPQWNRFFERLSQKFRVIVPEHPGFGTDTHADRIRDIADLAMYYLDFLDELGAGPVHLIGHALGGWTAAELATRNCSQLRSLTLIAPAGLRVKGLPMGDNFIWSPEELIRNLYHDQRLAAEILARPVTDEDADRQLTNRFMEARLGWQPRWFGPRLAQWLHRISVRSLLIWGREDRLMPSTHAGAWESGIPNLRKHLIAGCGHMPFVEKPSETADAILEFLGNET